MNKAQLRNKYKSLRDALNTNEKYEMEHAITQQSIELLSQFDTIGIYYSFGNELNTKDLIDSLLKLNKKIYLPRVEENQIVMCRYKSGNPLKSSDYGIKEPINPMTPIASIEVVIAPMLAYNSQGYRLGYGGGYYDRLLRNFKGLILGLAYDYSLSNDIPIEGHDIKCHQIITDREVKVFNEI